MHREQAEAAIRKLADCSDKIFLSEHGKKRAPSWGKHPLTKPEIAEALRLGRITEGPSKDIKIENGWKFKIVRKGDGYTHEVAGVLILVRDLVLVITAYEDKQARTIRRGTRPGGIAGDGSDTE